MGVGVRSSSSAQQKINDMTNLMLNKVIETLFTDEVYIDVKATSPSDNGTLPILKNIITTIKDDTLCLSTKYGTFFRLVRITHQNDSDYNVQNNNVLLFKKNIIFILYTLRKITEN